MAHVVLDIIFCFDLKCKPCACNVSVPHPVPATMGSAKVCEVLEWRFTFVMLVALGVTKCLHGHTGECNRVKPKLKGRGLATPRAIPTRERLKGISHPFVRSTTYYYRRVLVWI